MAQINQNLDKHSFQPPSTPNILLSWLDNVESQTLSKSASPEPEKLASLQTAPTTPGAHTPRRDASVPDYLSPTDTNFTEHSIFDKPVKEGKASGGVEDYDVFTISSASSVVGSEACASPLGEKSKVRIHVDLDHEEPAKAVSECGIETLESYDADIAEASGGLQHHYDDYASRPKLVWITSCLQCTLANLPCSHDLPACSRCIRAGRGNDCLAQRRKLDRERILGDHSYNIEPVLLQLQGEDEMAWERKRVLCDELLAQWREEEDHKNWVLPLNDGLRGSYWTTNIHHERRQSISLQHPGEGLGKPSPQTLRLA